MKFSVVILPAIMLCLCACGTESLNAFAQSCLNKHNRYRYKHGVLPLTLNNTMSNFAKKWAIHLYNTNELAHSHKKGLGENIWEGWYSDKKHVLYGYVPVDSWYSEGEDYNYNKEPSDNSAGHFTQVIWKATKQLGIGCICKTNKKGTTCIVVCEYYPPGNYIGAYRKNVLPPRK